MTSDELREKFLLFFKEKQHKIVPSSSLIPVGDPTLLLTSAGMVQFKPYFTGEAVPPSPRLASCQKCFRTTDIQTVGDFKHLTFFEMLGNFSIGDYFKKEAISWAWEFVTGWLKVPQEKLWITIYTDDEESFHHWREVGVGPERIGRCGEEHNFWGPAGETGPCGPCSEIHYDFGEEFGCGPACNPACDCGRFLEIWNLVFTEFYRDAEGRRTPLPRKNIDTGMGLERTAAVLQGVRSPYDTDLFAGLVQRLSELTRINYGSDEKVDRTMRIIVEHSRAVTFLVADGVIPANDGRGYVLRRILRRAAMFGRTLGLKRPFLDDMAEGVVQLMGHVYPELVSNRALIQRVLNVEEERFNQTSDRGFEILHGLIDYRLSRREAVPELIKAGKSGVSPEKASSVLKQHGLSGPVGRAGSFRQVGEEMAADTIAGLWSDFLKNESKGAADSEARLLRLKKWPDSVSGHESFILYDTYGFPAELTQELAAGQGLSVDLEGFAAEMEQQRERARASHRFSLGEKEASIDYASISLPPTEFMAYGNTRLDARVVSLAVEGETPDSVCQGQGVEVVLDRTPFYGEMGGQVGDSGEIIGTSGRIRVVDTIWAGGNLLVHVGEVIEGEIRLGESVRAEVDEARRSNIARNHTTTHLLHAALRSVLGSHVYQAGSLVAPDHFRFDFSQDSPVLEEELDRIQRLVNANIRDNLPVVKKEMTYKQAVAQGAIALFGEKYGENVRVVRIGSRGRQVSFEVCGGIHVARTGDIGFFLILSEGSIGSGMRRIEAVTGPAAEMLIEERLSALDGVAGRLQAPVGQVESKLQAFFDELEAEQRRAESLERELSRQEAHSLIDHVEVVKGVPVLAARVPASNMDILRHMGDVLRERLGSGVIVLGAVWADKPNFLAVVTSDLASRLNAGEIVRQVARATGGSGGGRPQLAQGGGRDVAKLDEALNLVKEIVEKKV